MSQRVRFGDSDNQAGKREQERPQAQMQSIEHRVEDKPQFSAKDWQIRPGMGRKPAVTVNAVELSERSSCAPAIWQWIARLLLWLLVLAASSAAEARNDLAIGKYEPQTFGNAAERQRETSRMERRQTAAGSANSFQNLRRLPTHGRVVRPLNLSGYPPDC